MKKFIEKSKDRKVVVWDQNKQLYITWEVIKGWPKGARKSIFNVTGIFSGADPNSSWTQKDAVNQLNWIIDYFYKAILKGKKEHSKNKAKKDIMFDELSVVQSTWQNILMGKQIIPVKKSAIRYLRQFKI